MNSTSMNMDLANHMSCLIGLDDTASVKKEESLMVNVFDGAKYSTKKKSSKPLAECLITSNQTVRDPRHVERIVHFPMKKGVTSDSQNPSNEDQERAKKWHNLINKDTPNPKDWVFSLSAYFSSQEFSDRLEYNTCT